MSGRPSRLDSPPVLSLVTVVMNIVCWKWKTLIRGGYIPILLNLSSLEGAGPLRRPSSPSAGRVRVKDGGPSGRGENRPVQRSESVVPRTMDR